jgi:hypothetical protein
VQRRWTAWCPSAHAHASGPPRPAGLTGLHPTAAACLWCVAVPPHTRAPRDARAAHTADAGAGPCEEASGPPPRRPGLGTLRAKSPATACAAPGSGAGPPPRGGVPQRRDQGWPAGQAWGGPVCRRCGLVCHQPRLRRARGHSAALALRRPGAPAGVMVTGVWSRRLLSARTTSSHLSALSLLGVARVRQPFRPSTQRPPTQRPPVFLPQRRQGA